MNGSVDGGVDILMIETIFDMQDSRAAIFAVDEYLMETDKERLPVMIRVTIADNGCRTMSCQTIEACFVNIKHDKALIASISCALGAAQMEKFYEMLMDVNPGWCHVYLIAGLLNAMGGYYEDPDTFSTNIYDLAWRTRPRSRTSRRRARACASRSPGQARKPAVTALRRPRGIDGHAFGPERDAKDGLLNFVGDCCGTLSSHIAAVAAKVKECPPRKLPALPKYTYMHLSGLEPCILTEDSGLASAAT